jgi:hypothetical protein
MNICLPGIKADSSAPMHLSTAEPPEWKAEKCLGIAQLQARHKSNGSMLDSYWSCPAWSVYVSAAALAQTNPSPPAAGPSADKPTSPASGSPGFFRSSERHVAHSTVTHRRDVTTHVLEPLEHVEGPLENLTVIQCSQVVE